MPPVIAKLFFERNRDLARGIAPGKVVVLDEDLILANSLSKPLESQVGH